MDWVYKKKHRRCKRKGEGKREREGSGLYAQFYRIHSSRVTSREKKKRGKRRRGCCTTGKWMKKRGTITFIPLKSINGCGLVQFEIAFFPSTSLTKKYRYIYISYHFMLIRLPHYWGVSASRCMFCVCRKTNEEGKEKKAPYTQQRRETKHKASARFLCYIWFNLKHPTRQKAMAAGLRTRLVRQMKQKAGWKSVFALMSAIKDCGRRWKGESNCYWNMTEEGGGDEEYRRSTQCVWWYIILMHRNKEEGNIYIYIQRWQNVFVSLHNGAEARRKELKTFDAKKEKKEK